MKSLSRFIGFIFGFQRYKSMVIMAYYTVVIVVDKAVCIITLDISIGSMYCFLRGFLCIYSCGYSLLFLSKK